ncbi:CARDB domain-containing protein [Paenibacillus gansuensis]|uniref:CARDB domain-containing protein n=1 Tax=Paenibacillus gansuensis TaxID=306542 RepID=A0ABW5PH18_9BACL
MDSITTWTATTYALTYELHVTYKKINADKPDLVADDITTGSAIKAGAPANFTATFHNDGPNITTPFNVKVMAGATTIKSQSFPNASNGATQQLSFSYTFPDTSQKTFTLSVDSAAAISEESETNNVLTKTFTPGTGPPKQFSADFDIIPDTIAWRQPFTLHPKDFQLNGCSYVSHKYKIERNGTYLSPVYQNQGDTTFSFGSYPWNIGVGYHSISMKMMTSCGETDWIGPRNLTVTSPATNNPPQFQIGFVYPNARTKAVNKIVAGEIMDLIYIDDPEIPTPTDPDQDNLYFMGFDFTRSTEFVESIPSRSEAYTDGQHHILMDTAGFHQVCGQMRDEWGATATACTYIEVVPPNPVAVPACPPPVIENHPVSLSSFSASQSYSPLNRGIDHTKDEWINRKTSYTNGTTSNLQVKVQLHVYDSEGLKSLQPGECEITVKPDLPPKAKLIVPPIGIRHQTIPITNASTSPDGDAITQAEYKFKYDDENNGFADDPWQSLSGTLSKANFTPGKVGKYLFYLKVTEQYGQQDDTSDEAESTLTFDAVNNAPEVSFEVEGKNPQPDLDPFTTVTAAQMLNWPVYVPNENQTVYNKYQLWKSQNGKLVSGEGRNFGSQTTPIHWWAQTRYSEEKTSVESFTMSNNGYGNNRLSPWRSQTGSTVSVPLLNTNGDKIRFNTYLVDYKFKIRSNKKLVYFSEPGFNDSSSQLQIYAVDPTKLSPVEMYVKPMQMYASYRYTGGDPYAFILKKPSQSRYINGVYAGCDYIYNWDLAERYLYISRSWKGSNTTFYEFAVYDAFTGELIRSSLDKPLRPNENLNPANFKFLYTRGENLVMVNEYDYSQGYYAPRIVELSPNLEVVRETVLSRPGFGPDAETLQQYNGTKDYYYGKFTPDASGAMYVYQFYYPSGTGWGGQNTYDLNVTKYNPDFTLAWRKYLKTDRKVYHTYTGLFMSGWTYSDDYTDVVYQPNSNEVLAKYYFEVHRPGDVIPTPQAAIAVLDAGTGNLKYVKPSSDSDFDQYFYGNSSWSDMGLSNYSFGWNGKRTGPNATTTVEGNRTTMVDPSCPGYLTGGNRVLDSAGNTIGEAGVPCNQRHQVFGEYFGDGVYVSMNSEYSDRTDVANLNISYGPPSTAPPLVRSFTQGQFYSDISLADAELRFTLNMEQVDYDQEWLGISFRMKDTRNRYALETNGNALQIVSYVNGSRTVLTQGSYPMASGTDYSFRLRFVSDQIEVWLNNIPILSLRDSRYSEGRFGYFADKSFVTFSPLRYKTVDARINWSAQYAIWDEGLAKAEVKYNNIHYEDPEQDPMAGSYQWRVQHTVRFINNQGLSTLHGKTFSFPQLLFDKVGDYLVTLNAKDDPHPWYLTPSMVFDLYRKPSNEFTRKVTVHRRPVSEFTLAQGPDGKITWSDTSRDPDRYQNTGLYSNEATGIDYRATKGIMERKYYYITPSGNYVNAKLASPQETGTYEAGMAVKDEYGAWSDWTIATITSGKNAPPNTPPVPGFTTSQSVVVRNQSITINSTAHDAEDGGRENLEHAYYVRSNAGASPETMPSVSRISWPTSFASLGTFTIRQVVTDSAGVPAQFEREITVQNQLPAANVVVPASTDPSAPERFKMLRPTFRWTYGDPDADPQTKYQVRILKYGGALQMESGVMQGGSLSWIPGQDLPENINMIVQVRVFDGYDWGDWSGAKYFYIKTNSPPTGDFLVYTYDRNQLAMPIYEGDLVHIGTLNLADADQNNLTVQYQVFNPANRMILDESYHFTFPYGPEGPSFQALEPGTYTVKQSISDHIDPAVIRTKTFQVRPLGISAEVNHTVEWEAWREKYNANHDPDRSANVFWAGEEFVLRSEVTDTADSWTKAVSVRAVLMEKSAAASLHSSNKLLWTGAMWRDDFYQLPDGNYVFTFTSVWSNGAVKQALVTIKIKGQVMELIRTHAVG